jgi:hypothetical protein
MIGSLLLWTLTHFSRHRLTDNRAQIFQTAIVTLSKNFTYVERFPSTELSVRSLVPTIHRLTETGPFIAPFVIARRRQSIRDRFQRALPCLESSRPLGPAWDDTLRIIDILSRCRCTSTFAHPTICRYQATPVHICVHTWHFDRHWINWHGNVNATERLYY